MLSRIHAAHLLSNWATLNHTLMSLKEEEVRQLLDAELADTRRRSFVQRLHYRLNRIRFDRERKELGL